MVDMHPEWSGAYTDTRVALQRVAVHICARVRFGATGRFGLRATPGGFGTPMFANEEVVRVADGLLVRERRVDERAVSATVALHGASLRELAGFVGVDLTAPFWVGRDTPPVGDLDEPLPMDLADGAVIADWYALGARALNHVLGILGPAGDPTVAQLWPEHFDIALDVAVGDTRANVGASPGDGFSATPYLYVGPWSDARPGDEAFWNAPFGAVRTLDEVHGIKDAAAFFTRGLDLLADA